MIMRPDLFEQHTVHFTDIPMLQRSTTEFLTPRWISTSAAASRITTWPRMPELTSGTAISRSPEHCRWAWWGQLYVRPRQNRVTAGSSLYTSLVATGRTIRARLCRRPGDGGATNVTTVTDILCSNPVPADAGVLPGQTAATLAATGIKYAYNDGDGRVGL